MVDIMDSENITSKCESTVTGSSGRATKSSTRITNAVSTKRSKIRTSEVCAEIDRAAGHDLDAGRPVKHESVEFGTVRTKNTCHVSRRINCWIVHIYVCVGAPAIFVSRVSSELR